MIANIEVNPWVSEESRDPPESRDFGGQTIP